MKEKFFKKHTVGQVLYLIMLYLAVACSDSPEVTPDNPDGPDGDQTQAAAKFNDAIKNKQVPYANTRSSIPADDVGKTKEVSKGADEEEGDFVCNVVRYKAAAEYNENVILNPTTDVFFPGAIIKGESIENGKYIPLGTGNRTKINVSTSLTGIQGSVSQETDATLSGTRQAITDILNQEVAGSTPAEVSFEIVEIFESNQLNLAIGAGYNYDDGLATQASISTSFEFNNSNVKSRFMIKYIQKYYSIDVDAKASAADFFADISILDTNQIGAIPMYISSVKYGRMVFFTIESSEESTALKAALEATFKVGNQSGEFSLSSENMKVLNESSMKATVIGGSGEDAAGIAVGGIEGVKTYLKRGGNYSKDSPGVPVGFVMRSIYDNSVMKAILASEYNIRQCTKVRSNVRFTLERIENIRHNDGAGSNAEIFGDIAFKYTSACSSCPSTDWYFLWQVTSDYHISLPESGGTIFPNKSIVHKLSSKDIQNGVDIFFDIEIEEYDKTGSNDKIAIWESWIRIKDVVGRGSQIQKVVGDGEATVVWRVDFVD